MTTIAYRDGVMASDTGAWLGGACLSGLTKLAKGRDGSLHGVAGNSGACCAYLEWVRSGEGPRPTPEKTSEGSSSFVALRVSPDRKEIRLLTSTGDEVFDGLPYVSIGAGAVAALGAMYAGATPFTAIQAAIEHTEGARGEVAFIAFPEAVAEMAADLTPVRL